MRIFDVSMTLSEDLPVWPGAPKYQLQQHKTSLPKGGPKTDSHFSMIPHFGTHIDAPLHFDPAGASIEQLDVNLLMGPCVVYEHKARRDMTREDLIAMGLEQGPRVLFKTANSGGIKAGVDFDRDYVSFAPDAIDYLVEVGVKLLGIDGYAIGSFEKSSDPNHVRFCGSGGVIIELLDLSGIAPGSYELMALPVKMAGLEAAPARVLLLEKNDV